MQFLLSVHGSVDHGEFGPYGSREEMEQAFDDTAAFNDRLETDGHLVFAGGLLPSSHAREVSPTGEVTDGPRLSGPEWLSGMWIIEVSDAETALDLAAAGAKACRGSVEVRPFAEG